MAKVDIVVPIYNVEEYLERNLESLRTQTYKDIRVLCINDGCTDQSQKIIDQFVSKDSRFESYIKKNGGLSDARNFGLKYVDSEYVMFIDSDDFCEENMVELSVEQMDSNGLDMLVFAYNQYYVEDGRKEKIELGIEDGVYNLKENKDILAKTPNAAWNKMYRTNLFKEHDIEYPFGYRHQDLGTTAKLMLHSNKIGYINEALYNYLIDRPNNITAQIDKKLYHIIDMSKEIMDYYKAQKVFDLYKEEFKYLVTRNFIQSLRKAVRLKDKDFVNQFLDDIFEVENDYFKNVKDKYGIVEVKDDNVYMNKMLLKAYYLYKQLKEK